MTGPRQMETLRELAGIRLHGQESYRPDNIEHFRYSAPAQPADVGHTPPTATDHHSGGHSAVSPGPPHLTNFMSVLTG